jgi:hypothetical protein
VYEGNEGELQERVESRWVEEGLKTRVREGRREGRR